MKSRTDHLGVLNKLLESSRIIEHVAVDANGVIRECNEGFARHVGLLPDTANLIYRFLPEDDGYIVQEWLRTQPPSDAVLLNFVGPDSFPYTLRCYAAKVGALLHIVGEPDYIGEGQTTEQLVAINNEMAMLNREHARRGRELEQLRQQLARVQAELEKAR